MPLHVKVCLTVCAVYARVPKAFLRLYSFSRGRLLIWLSVGPLNNISVNTEPMDLSSGTNDYGMFLQ